MPAIDTSGQMFISTGVALHQLEAVYFMECYLTMAIDVSKSQLQ